jgi:hypothetical protein
MKRLLLLVASVFTVSVVAAAQAPTQLAVSLQFIYGSWPVCTATVTTNCIAGFNIYDTTTTKTLIGTLPNPASPSGTVTVIGNLTFPSVPALGSHIAVASTAYVDSLGNKGESAASAPAPFQVQPPAPTSLSVH